MKKLLKNFLIMLLDFENPIRNFPKAYKDISYKIYDDIDIYKTINSYEQVFDNIEAVNYYKDIYNQIIFEYKIN